MKNSLTFTKNRRNRLFSLFLTFLTITVTLFSPINPATITHAAMEYPEEILIDIDMAQESFKELLTEKEIYALVYLCDNFELKTQPDTLSDTVVSIETGQFVQITGVAQDESYYIWYQVQTEVGDTSYSGYILRDNLAYSDEDLLNWELDNIMTLSMSLFALAPVNETEDLVQTIPEDIQAFPASYREGLLALKAKHPNWIFVPFKTRIAWNTAITKENSGNRSLLHSANKDYLLAGSYDASWSYPTNGTLAYYMDPRNFLTENYIFQFEFLNYNTSYHTEDAVQSILNGTFMEGAIPDESNNLTYAQAFCNIGTQLNVSPFHLASRVRQEQGSQGTSALISGTHEKYPGVYNYFNVGATGKGTTENIETGLAKATEYGWTSRYASLYGGSDIISKNYIRKGQNTLYLQKFNVNRLSSYGLYNHQYMQNIAAPSSEATSIRSAYATAGSLDNPFVFSIPVYDNMPANACLKPQAAKELVLGETAYNLTADETAQLTFCLDGLVTNASAITFSSSNPDIASVSEQGIITAGNAGTATITCTVDGAASVSCTVSVNKAVPSVTLPVLEAVAYAPEQTLADISLPSGWTWDNPSIVPTVENAGYPVTYTPDNTNKYELVKSNLTLTVNKGTPLYQIPENLETVEGNVLASLKLPAGFAWLDSATVLEETGHYPATYNPDEANYETVTDILIPVTVRPIIIECTEHTYGEWIITTEAACEKDGEQEHFCNLCGEKETQTIPALEHKYSSAVTKEATETETGIRTFTCDLCDDSYTETIDKLPVSHKHSYTEKVTVKATCETNGIRTYTCSCNDSYTEEIPALKHNYSSAVTKEPTESAEGIRTYTCSNCSASYTESIAKLPESHKHSYTESIIKQATCLEKGLKTFTCTCKDSYTEEIQELGHDMADGTCRRCGYTEPKEEDTTTPAPDTDVPNTDKENNNNTGSDDTNTGNDTNTNTNTNTNTGSTNTTTGTSNNTGNTTAGTTNTENSNTTTGTSNNTENPNITTGTTTPTGNTTTGTNDTVTSTNTNNTNTDTSNNTDSNNTDSNNTDSNTSASNAATSNSEQSTNTSTQTAPFIATLNMKNNTVLYEETIAAIRGRDVDVVLQMNEQVHWTIIGSNIVSDEANGIDMGVTVNADVIPKDIMTQAAKLSETNNVIELSLAHDGPIDFMPVLTIDTNRANAGRMATLFYYNPETNELEFRDEVLIAEDGSISFTFNHASDYAVIISEEGLTNLCAITATGAIEVQNDEASNPSEEQDTTSDTVSDAPTSEEMSGLSSKGLIIILAALFLFIAAGILLIAVSHKKTRYETDDEDSYEDDFYAESEDYDDYYAEDSYEENDDYIDPVADNQNK